MSRPSKQDRQRVEAAVAATDRLVSIVQSWRVVDDRHRAVDPREAWLSTGEAAAGAIIQVLDGLDAGGLRDAAATCACRVREVTDAGSTIPVDTPDRLRIARTAMGVAGEVLRPAWATVPVRHIAELRCTKDGKLRVDNVRRSLDTHGVRMARWRGATYASGDDLVACDFLSAKEIQVLSLTAPSLVTHFSSIDS